MHGCPRKLELELFKAAMAEDTIMIVRLLEAGADADAQNEGGQTALELAATRGKLRSLFVRAASCAQQYVGKSQSCMVISGRLSVHAPVADADRQANHAWLRLCVSGPRRLVGDCV